MIPFFISKENFWRTNLDVNLLRMWPLSLAYLHFHVDSAEVDIWPGDCGVYTAAPSGICIT